MNSLCLSAGFTIALFTTQVMNGRSGTIRESIRCRSHGAYGTSTRDYCRFDWCLTRRARFLMSAYLAQHLRRVSMQRLKDLRRASPPLPPSSTPHPSCCSPGASPDHEFRERPQRSRMARLNWSTTGLSRYDIAVRSSVDINTSTGIPGSSLSAPILANSSWLVLTWPT
jgi:hypothetical protein